MASYQLVLRFFRPISLILRLPQRNKARSYEVAPVTQNHLSKPEDVIVQNATLLRKSAPWPLNMSAGYVSCTAPATWCLDHPDTSSWNAPRLPSFLQLLQHPHVWLSFDQFFDILTSKRASRHSGVHFLNIFNVQKCSDNEVLWLLLLGNVLHTTALCTFSTSQLPKVFRKRKQCFLAFWVCQRGMQFLISHLNRCLRTPAQISNLRRHKTLNKIVFRDFSIFSRTRIFFLLTLFLLCSSFFFLSLLWLFPLLLLHLSILSEVGLLKLPSANPKWTCEILCIWTVRAQNVANTSRKMKSSNFKMLHNAVEMIVSSSKMLQIAREADRTGDLKKTKRKKIVPKTIPGHLFFHNASHAAAPAAGQTQIFADTVADGCQRPVSMCSNMGNFQMVQSVTIYRLSHC